MKNLWKIAIIVIYWSCFSSVLLAQAVDVRDKVEHHYADNEGVKIHYVSMGKGPLVLFIHGFPDFWYTWRHQMTALASTHRVVAMDLRGYNLSDQPQGVKQYQYEYLMRDVKAVIEDAKAESAYVVAHDWGAAIAWNFAAHYPDHVEKLVVLSIAHPKANKRKPIPIEDRKSSYADFFATKDFYEQLTADWFSGWVKDTDAKKIYKDAFSKSSKDAMINYYRANFPLLENLKDQEFIERSKKVWPNIQMPVRIIHGEQDKYAPTAAHNNTWTVVDNEVSIFVLPNAGHFVQRDESERVTNLIKEFISSK